VFQLSGTMHYTTCCLVDDLPLESEVYPSSPLGTKKKIERDGENKDFSSASATLRRVKLERSSLDNIYGLV